MLEFTHCDAIMIGKAAIYLPGIFTLIKNQTHSYAFSIQERLSWINDYYRYAKITDTLKRGRFNQRIEDIVPESKDKIIKEEILTFIENDI